MSEFKRLTDQQEKIRKRDIEKSNPKRQYRDIVSDAMKNISELPPLKLEGEELDDFEYTCFLCGPSSKSCIHPECPICGEAGDPACISGSCKKDWDKFVKNSYKTGVAKFEIPVPEK